MLMACGLSDLIAPDLGSYEATALSLASERNRLSALRAKLAAARESSSLFDLDTYRKRIEAAYFIMHDRACRGLPTSPIEAAALSI
jgi:predicted O-linked N-acetylglucosamine transferase (SPINDLY family)